MDISPQRVRTAEFDTVKRGLDPDQVRGFLTEVAAELERAQNQSTAMEARARAAVARLQELSEGTVAAAPAPAAEPSAPAEAAPVEAPPASEPAAAQVTASVDEAETISRTLLLAQRTADVTVAEAIAEAERIARDAEQEANRSLDSTRELSTRMLDDAREEARQAGDEERKRVETEVDSLSARREFLEADVDSLEAHLSNERIRLREAATTLLDITERVPGGLGEVRRPVLSASETSARDVDPGDRADPSSTPDRDDSDDGVADVTVMGHDEPDVDVHVRAEEASGSRDGEHGGWGGGGAGDSEPVADGPTIRGDEPDPLLRGND
ncbi:DivIVA domain-containing protein [Ilumatobacter sp.]|uniref:DivIVA domain-containing protein n=1 Tax=Ilumatobacter sp. TaxID=1967498 RepID=UPI003B51E68D